MKSPTANTTNLRVTTQPLVAARYSRVSTSDQEDQETIGNQTGELQERIEADGHIFSPKHDFKDDGWTGTILERPGLDAMRDAAANDEFQVLYVYDRGRLARDFVFQEVVIRELADRGIQFVTLHDPPADTPEQQVMQGMYGLFAQYERIKILERTRRGRIRKAKEGFLISGQALYGYTRVAKTEATPAHWSIDAEESRIVRMVFDWVGKEAMAMNEVRQQLYNLGIPTKKRKTKWWSKSTILRMLKNKTYINGIHYYNTSEAIPAKNPIKKGYKRVKNTSKKARPEDEWIPFEVPILLNRAGDKYLYDKIQNILTDNKKFARQRQRHDYLLSGFIYCECGKRRAGDGQSKHGHYYYRCVERIFTAPDKWECIAMGVNAVAVDSAVWHEVTTLMTKPDLLHEQAERWLKEQAQHNTAADAQRAHFNEQLRKIEQQEERYQRAHGAGTMSFEQLEKLILESRSRKAGIAKELQDINEKYGVNGEVSTTQLEAVCAAANITLKKLDFSNKRAIIRDLVDKVIVYGQKQVKICGHLPLTTQKLGSCHENRYRRSSQRRKNDTV